jgi:sRNA-binding regulator protein Hfq
MDVMKEMGRPNSPGRPEERIALSEIELIKYRDNRTALVVQLITGEALEGAIRWYDDRALRLVQADRTEITVFMQAIAYYKPRV